MKGRPGVGSPRLPIVIPSASQCAPDSGRSPAVRPHVSARKARMLPWVAVEVGEGSRAAKVAPISKGRPELKGALPRGDRCGGRRCSRCRSERRPPLSCVPDLVAGCRTRASRRAPGAHLSAPRARLVVRRSWRTTLGWEARPGVVGNEGGRAIFCADESGVLRGARRRRALKGGARGWGGIGTMGAYRSPVRLGR